MPNWVQNTVTLTVRGARNAKRIDEVLERIRELQPEQGREPSPVDFERLLPMPEELKKVTTGFHTIDGEEVRSWHEEVVGDRRVATKIPQDVLDRYLREFGAANWYDWAILNWGTKWNVADGTLTRKSPTCAVLTFDTAWSPPVRWADAFADLCRGNRVSVRWTYRDEYDGFSLRHELISAQSGRPPKVSDAA